MAIFMAMCGIDYSGVREHYTPPKDEVKGSSVKEYFRGLEDRRAQVRPKWQLVSESFLPSDNWFFRELGVFYDTDCFKEHRREYIRPCTDCGGTVLIMTKHSMTYERGVLVRIPFGTCPACRQDGEQLYASLKEQDSKMNRVVLQDQEAAT
jgi:hypothetical protein